MRALTAAETLPGLQARTHFSSTLSRLRLRAGYRFTKLLDRGTSALGASTSMGGPTTSWGRFHTNTACWRDASATMNVKSNYLLHLYGMKSSWLNMKTARVKPTTSTLYYSSATKCSIPRVGRHIPLQVETNATRS